MMFKAALQMPLSRTDELSRAALQPTWRELNEAKWLGRALQMPLSLALQPTEGSSTKLNAAWPSA